jgi:hypothetical protein
VDKINDAELVEDRIRPVELRLAPHNLDVPRALLEEFISMKLQPT